jgi:hypothetical protein
VKTMRLISRAAGILLRPKDEWPRIKEESLSASKFFSSYVLVLAAVPSISHFIRFGLVGYRVPFGGWYRLGIGNALFRAVLVYGLTLASVYVLALVINALAPAFKSTKDPDKAMKLAAYTMTPYLVVSIFYFIPWLGNLLLFAGLYGIYILYLGFKSAILDTPQKKVVGYWVISVIIALILIGAVWAVLEILSTLGRVTRLS